MFRASWVADYPDAENYLSLYYSNNFAPNGPNYTHFKNELFDEWYQQAFTETNIVEREKLYTKMDSLVMREAPLVPLFYDEVVRFTRKNVEGLGINPINLLDLKYVRKH
jgi:peptide/nickel transport system substrate-binding protein